MLKRIGPFLFILIFAVCASGAEKIPIAIMDMEAIDVPANTARAVSDLIRTELFNTGLFRVFERAEIDKIVKEQQFGLTGLSDVDSAVKLGKLLQAKKVLVGSVSKLGTAYIVNARIIDVERGEMEFADKAKSDTETDLDKAVEEFARLIAKRIQAGQSADQTTIEKKTAKPRQEKIKVRTSSPAPAIGLRKTGLILGVSGLGLGAAGTVFHLLGHNNYKAYMALVQPTDDYAGAWKKVQTDMTIRAIGWIGGGALLVTGAILYIAGGKSAQNSMSDGSENYSVAFMNDGMTLSYTGRW